MLRGLTRLQGQFLLAEVVQTVNKQMRNTRHMMIGWTDLGRALPFGVDAEDGAACLRVSLALSPLKPPALHTSLLSHYSPSPSLIPRLYSPSASTPPCLYPISPQKSQPGDYLPIRAVAR